MNMFFKSDSTGEHFKKNKFYNRLSYFFKKIGLIVIILGNVLNFSKKYCSVLRKFKIFLKKVCEFFDNQQIVCSHTKSNKSIKSDQIFRFIDISLAKYNSKICNVFTFYESN